MKDLRRLQQYLVEMGSAENEDLEGIIVDANIDTDSSNGFVYTLVVKDFETSAGFLHPPTEAPPMATIH